MEEATAKYQGLVTPEVARYLMDRGIEQGVASTFRLGAVEEPIPGHDMFHGRLAIPYIVAGHPVTIRFRCLRDHDCKTSNCPKYLPIPDEPTRMYNVSAITRAAYDIDVTEGELDALVLEQLGYPAVAIPGVHNWKSHHRRMLAGFSKVRVWGDGDQAGAEFGNKITKALRQAKVVRVPKGEDVTSLLLRDGAEAIHDLIERTYG